VLNEGCATFVHHYVVNALYDGGRLSEGHLLEILHNHSNVVFQPAFNDQRFSGVNPYALGFAMMRDIQRMCTAPTEEDRAWFPDIAGSGEWRATLRHAWANFRDESFIRQYLSPNLIRRLRLFLLVDDATDSHYTVSAIHDEDGYRRVRDALAQSYDLGVIEPDLQVVDVNLKGDRELQLCHTLHQGIPLADRPRNEVLRHVRQLWGYPVTLIGLDARTQRETYRVSTRDWDT